MAQLDRVANPPRAAASCKAQALVVAEEQQHMAQKDQKQQPHQPHLATALTRPLLFLSLLLLYSHTRSSL